MRYFEDKIFKDLNDKQIEAVRATEGPVLILAGAGSGKTRALTHRIAYMIANGISPHNILGVTFTNKAAGEIKDRINTLLTTNNQSLTTAPWLGTFHSICLRILRHEVLAIVPYTSNFVVYDEDDQLGLIKKVMADLDINTKKFNPKNILGRISALKNELVGHEKFADTATEYYEKIVAPVYAGYQGALEQNNALDFDDLIMLCVRILQKYPKTLEKYQNIFKYILVDECLPGNTPVLLADGSTVTIGQIVKNRLSVEVLSYNIKTGQQEPKKVSSWREIPASDKKLIKITVAKRCHQRNRYKTSFKKTTIRNLFCTSNHRVFANGQFVEAGGLKIGDILQWESSFTKYDMRLCQECGEIYKTHSMHPARHKAYPIINCGRCKKIYKTKYYY